jgi:hypothetical protein
MHKFLDVSLGLEQNENGCFPLVARRRSAVNQAASSLHLWTTLKWPHQKNFIPRAEGRGVDHENRLSQGNQEQ